METPRTRSGRRRVAAAPDSTAVVGGGEVTPSAGGGRPRRGSARTMGGGVSSALPSSSVAVGDRAEQSPALNSRRALNSLNAIGGASPAGAWRQPSADTSPSALYFRASRGGRETAEAVGASALPSPDRFGAGWARSGRWLGRSSWRGGGESSEGEDTASQDEEYNSKKRRRYSLTGSTTAQQQRIGTLVVVLGLSLVCMYRYPVVRPWRLVMRSGDVVKESGGNASVAVWDTAADDINFQQQRQQETMDLIANFTAKVEAKIDKLSQRLNEIDEVVTFIRTDIEEDRNSSVSQRQDEIVHQVDSLKVEVDSLKEEVTSSREEIQAETQRSMDSLAQDLKRPGVLKPEEPSRQKQLRDVTDEESEVAEQATAAGLLSAPPITTQRTMKHKELQAAVMQLWRDVHLGSTGVRNWAQEALGASIVHTHTTPGHNTKNWSERVLRYFTELPGTGRWRGTAAPVSKAPEVLLKQSNAVMSPGDCFTFSSNEANVTIQLSRPVYVSEVAIEHAMPGLVVDKSTAPHRFAVLGWPAAEFLSYGAQHSADSQREVPNASLAPVVSLLGTPTDIGEEEFTFEYPHYRLQIFPTKVPTQLGCMKDAQLLSEGGGCGKPVPMRRITFQFLQNNGGDWTSVYRLRVHGDAAALSATPAAL